MAAYSASNPPVEATTTQNTTQGDSPYTQVNLKLQRLMSGETNTNKNPIIRQIHSITERKIENLKAEKNQFRFRNGKVLFLSITQPIPPVLGPISLSKSLLLS